MNYYEIREHDGFWLIRDSDTKETVLCWVPDHLTARGWVAVLEEQRKLIPQELLRLAETNKRKCENE